jgi:hypothetical protein
MDHGRFAQEIWGYELEAVNTPQTGIREKWHEVENGEVIKCEKENLM